MVLMIVLLFIAVPVALYGVITLTQATQGVGTIAVACFLAILARLAQADWLSVQERRAKRGLSEPVTDPPALHIVGCAAPPMPGEKLRLPRSLQLFEAANSTSSKVAILPRGVLFAVVSAQPGWIFVQSEDGSLEGWAQVL